MYRPPPILAPILYIPGMIYQAGVRLRNLAFDSGLLPVRDLPRPTISVGNLTLGGTGKTPFVIYLAGFFREMGLEAAILTRGYGRRESGKTIILPPEENPVFLSSHLGDEPALIRRRLPETWLGISSDRFQAATAIAQSEERAKRTAQLVFIMDDGFQRRDIRRDLDIVMVDPTHPPNTERLFPPGILREPAAELRRAHIVVINGSSSTDAAGTQNARVGAVAENLRKYAPEADFFHCAQRIQTLLPFPAWRDSQTPPHPPKPPAAAFLVAAIGNPERFRQDIRSLGIEARECAFFRDHAVIGRKDWEICANAARMAKAEAIIVTEKDAVKISSPPDFPLFVAVQNTELQNAARFREILQRRVCHKEHDPESMPR